MAFTRLSAILLLLSVLIAPQTRASADPPGAPMPVVWPAAGPHQPGVVLVRFWPAMAQSGLDALREDGIAAATRLPMLNVYAVATPLGQEAAVAARLSLRREVAYAELDYLAASQEVPNDPNYPKQWGLTQIAAPQAWNQTTGASSLIIGVLDTGIDLGHPDLAGKVWVNAGEIPGDAVDNDRNGFIDDVHGWHFFGDGGPGNADVADDNGHGTHVAGIAGAATNNGIGVAGVTWDSPVMVVKVLGSDGLGPYSDIAAGILYAVANGARIINLSLGGQPFSQTLCDAVALATAKGRLVVAAVGNQGDQVLYPAMCPGALAVAATDASDKHAAFSNRGARVDLAAPGVDIWSTFYRPGLSTYAALDGTSAAAPFVAGAAALVWSRWPGLTAEAVKAQLLATVADAGRPGKDDETGWGRLDAGSAVADLAAPVDLQVSTRVTPMIVVAGNPMTATFQVTNTGGMLATSVTLYASLVADATVDGIQSAGASCNLIGSAMTCGASRLDPGGSAAVSVVMTPTVVGVVTVEGLGELTISASVNAAQRELTPSDNRQTVKTRIRPVLSGRVFLDSNGDGIHQPWEGRGVSDAWLFLQQDGRTLAYTTSQGPNGAYHFDTLALGGYVLHVAQLPPGFMLTTPEDIALAIEPATATVAYFGAWTGKPEPTPSPTVSPCPSSNCQRLPLIVR